MVRGGRWLATSTLLIAAACSEERATPPPEAPAAPLVIPPIDAGAPRPAARTVADAPPTEETPAPPTSLANGADEIGARDPRHAAHSSDAAEIQRYERLVADPNYPQADEARYYLGLAHERQHDWRKARSSYYELIKSHPQSRMIPYAYFAFGEMFYADAATDPSKHDLARQAFQEVIKYPAPANPLYPYALLRLGQTETRAGNAAQAKQWFARLTRDFPGSDAAHRIPP